MRPRVIALAALTLAWCIVAAVPVGALTKSQLRAKALSLSNFPTGWTVDNSSSGGSSITGGCLAGIKSGPKTQTKVSVSFVNGQLPQLNELLATGRGSVASYNRVNHTLAGCKHFTESKNGQSVTFTVGAMSFPAVGDASSAYSMTFSVQGINAGADFVLFKVGSVVGVIEYANIGQPDPTQLQGFVTEAVNKVEGKSTITPTTV